MRNTYIANKTCYMYVRLIVTIYLHVFLSLSCQRKDLEVWELDQVSWKVQW